MNILKIELLGIRVATFTSKCDYSEDKVSSPVCCCKKRSFPLLESRSAPCQGNFIDGRNLSWNVEVLQKELFFDLFRDFIVDV